jgi:protein-tyrosine phosphatase
MIDIHNHLFINIDDGPSSKKEVVNLLAQAIEQGVTHIICTPHHHSGSYVTPSDVVAQKISEVKNIIKENDFNIEVHPGQEIRINNDILNELDLGISIPLNNTHYVLVEFSFTELREDVHDIFEALRARGYTPIIAHPERCMPIAQNDQHLRRLIKDGAKAQVTAASVVGELGADIQKISLNWIKEGLIQIVASDAHHASHRPFQIKEALQKIEKEAGRKIHDQLVSNAEAVLNDETF